MKACEIELAAEKAFIDSKIPTLVTSNNPPWWAKPEVVVGGMVLSLWVGASVGLLIAVQSE